jgi:hypothetical protein
MGPKAYAGVAALIFTIVAIAQFARAAMGLELIVAGYAIPLVVSTIAGVVAAILAVAGFLIAKS